MLIHHILMFRIFSHICGYIFEERHMSIQSQINVLYVATNNTLYRIIYTKHIRKSQASLHSDSEAANEQNVPVVQKLLPRMPEHLKNTLFEHYTLSDTTRAPNDEAVVSRMFEMAIEGDKSAIMMCDFLVCVGKIVEKRVRKTEASFRSDIEASVRSGLY